MTVLQRVGKSMGDELKWVGCPWIAGGMPAAGGLVARPVPAGFPSPADDYVESRISLDEHLIRHREATFFVRVAGDSMSGLGIFDGDLLVVDRALTPVDGSVVIAVTDDGFTVKQLYRRPGGGAVLKAAHPGYANIEIGADGELSIWGVVRWAIHRVWPWNDER